MAIETLQAMIPDLDETNAKAWFAEVNQLEWEDQLRLMLRLRPAGKLKDFVRLWCKPEFAEWTAKHKLQMFEPDDGVVDRIREEVRQACKE